GDAKYLDASINSFNYERHWFDAEAANWPDFRSETGRGQRKRPLSFSTFWCHGAPGIAFSRLRAFEILGDEMCRKEATTALQTTYKITARWLHSGAGNYSLCHGLAGNSEVLLYGSQVLGQELAVGSGLALEVATAGIERYARFGLSWPCGVGVG